MHPLPTTPHDWALWLFEQLEGVECIGAHWQGRLPVKWNFEDIENALPDNLKGILDSQSRIVEFHPSNCNVYETLDELVQGQRRRNVPPVFTVRDLHYTHGKTEPVLQQIRNYLDAVKFWQLLQTFADYEVNQTIVFIKSFESKVEVRAEYGAADLLPLAGLAEFASTYFEADHHRDQKRNIIRASLLEVCKGQIVTRLSELLPKFGDLVDRVKASYSLYTADFSFEKLQSEVDKQNVEDMLRLNKTLAEIQNQLLALPAALMLASAGVKDGVFATNISIWIGISVFAWVMSTLVTNQQNSVTAIEQEVQLRIEKITNQPADIANRVSPRFNTLNSRIKRQRRVLTQIFWAVIFIWFIATGIVVNAQLNASPTTTSESQHYCDGPITSLFSLELNLLEESANSAKTSPDQINTFGTKRKKTRPHSEVTQEVCTPRNNTSQNHSPS